MNGSENVWIRAYRTILNFSRGTADTHTLHIWIAGIFFISLVFFLPFFYDQTWFLIDGGSRVRKRGSVKRYILQSLHAGVMIRRMP